MEERASPGGGKSGRSGGAVGSGFLTEPSLPGLGLSGISISAKTVQSIVALCTRRFENFLVSLAPNANFVPLIEGII